jgi:hypothetical protein
MTTMRLAAIVLVFSILNSCSLKRDIRTILSPDKSVQVSFSDEGGRLKYLLHWQDQEMVSSSELSIFHGKTFKIISASVRTLDESWNPVWGQFSEIQDHYNELVFELDMEGIRSKLFTRVYDQGVAFRFELNEAVEGDSATLYCEYNLADDDEFYCPAGEKEPLGPLVILELKNNSSKPPRISMPVVVEKSNNKFLSFLESDLYAAEGFQAMQLNFDQEKGMLVSSNNTVLQGEKMVTPWRVILVGETAGDLVCSTVPVNLATPCQLENTDWIKPGKTLWDWRVHGYKATDGFTYGINTESYLRFINFASEKGIEYFLIDAGWYQGLSEDHFVVSDNLDLDQVVEYATQKGVGIILYYDKKHGDFGDDKLFPYYQSLGMSGIKYGFMGRNVGFSRDAIRKSAQSELLIDFHDGPVPFTGIRRTYPNAITREYCHAQQDSRRVFTPEAFIKMALINAIQGPLDMNNGNFDITGINAGKRQKGPRKLNSYLSTVTSETARTLIIFSGLVCIPDAPEAYEAKKDLFEFIQKQPAGKWDESQIIHSQIGDHITTARRHGEEWFIGSVINQQGGTLDISLDFLEAGLSYEATFYEDTEQTHCKTNPEAYQIRTGQVKKGDLIQAKLAPGGGHCMWIRPK